MAGLANNGAAFFHSPQMWVANKIIDRGNECAASNKGSMGCVVGDLNYNYYYHHPRHQQRVREVPCLPGVPVPPPSR